MPFSREDQNPRPQAGGVRFQEAARGLRFLIDPGCDVQTQMARDASLLAEADADSAFVATLRLFTFVPAGITLGRSQDPGRELDLERCRRDGIDWAVRPTGGRAIFHEHEWTYSLTARIDDPDWGGSRARAYERCSALVTRSLHRLGVPAQLERGGRGEADGEPRARMARAPCFASTARHEVTLGGRKLVGSAQRRTRTALLQQGSLLLGPGHLRIVDYLAGPQGERTREALRQRSADAGGSLRGVGIEAWAEALKQEWMSCLETTNRVATGVAGVHA